MPALSVSPKNELLRGAGAVRSACTTGPACTAAASAAPQAPLLCGRLVKRPLDTMNTHETYAEGGTMYCVHSVHLGHLGQFGILHKVLPIGVE